MASGIGFKKWEVQLGESQIYKALECHFEASHLSSSSVDSQMAPMDSLQGLLHRVYKCLVSTYCLPGARRGLNRPHSCFLFQASAYDSVIGRKGAIG